ncbi:Cytosol aminopeptidase [Candidatus Cyrtobacter comes]|uniref:Probable cytosol aminopeptidase n=1 Tax=Candidatus Cyrtobacter comes TaxID=675776 RepID=A0ABU5L7W3_9RICK|nr:leucyl aminopeptidase [Candidatus Cyrtobacter comes]MDZ5761990.1 Cytosol aminopeptidase [Candidatus Cyrtobacter comes]
MDFAISTSYKESAVAFFAFNREFPKMLRELDTDNMVLDVFSADKCVNDKSCSITKVLAPKGKLSQKTVFVVNIVKKTDEDLLDSLSAACASLTSALNNAKITSVDICTEITASLDKKETVISILNGIKLSNYTFNKYFVKKKKDNEKSLVKANLITDLDIKHEIEANIAVLDGTLRARDLQTEPANHLYPESFANLCKKMETVGVKCNILSKDEMLRLGMGAFIGVAQGSAYEPKLVALEWIGNNNNTSPIVLVGKGITFDTGGVNLKPTPGMTEMKSDMGGAAVVACFVESLAKRKTKVNVVGILALAENMISGTAQRPSDVVTSMSGQTIEIDNTDAEGRLVLADAMWYAQEVYKPKIMIDLATLTGAITIALGDTYAGLFSNDKELETALISAGQKCGELLWHFPMSKKYDAQINSDIADVKNTGQSGRGGGSITAAHFLQRFVKEGVKWAHIDIAAVTRNKYDDKPLYPKGYTGFGVRLLNEFIKSNYEA